MAVGNDALMPLVTDIKYEARGLLDHSPLILTLGLGKRWEGREWKVYPFWLQLISPKEHMLIKIREFLEYNRPSAAQGVVWDILKAYLRGIIIQLISRRKKITKYWEVEIMGKVTDMEKIYVEDSSPEDLVKLTEAEQFY